MRADGAQLRAHWSGLETLRAQLFKKQGNKACFSFAVTSLVNCGPEPPRLSLSSSRTEVRSAAGPRAARGAQAGTWGGERRPASPRGSAHATAPLFVRPVLCSVGMLIFQSHLFSLGGGSIRLGCTFSFRFVCSLPPRLCPPSLASFYLPLLLFRLLVHLFLSGLLPSLPTVFYLLFWPPSFVIRFNFLLLWGSFTLSLFSFSAFRCLPASPPSDLTAAVYIAHRSAHSARTVPAPGRPVQSAALGRDLGWVPSGLSAELSRVPVPGGAPGAERPPPSGRDQRSQANCFSLSPNCGFYQESLFQRTQTRSSADSLISSADPHTPPHPPLHTLTNPGWAKARAARPLRGGPPGASAAQAASGRAGLGGPALGLGCRMWPHRWGGRVETPTDRQMWWVAARPRASLPGSDAFRVMARSNRPSHSGRQPRSARSPGLRPA